MAERDEKGLIPKPLHVEIVENPLQGQPAINVNILLQQVTRDADPSQALENADKALELAKKWEDHNLQVFKQRAEAAIQYKERDPDELEKRKSNGLRRSLKKVIATGGIIGVGGMLTVAGLGGSMVVAVLSGLVGAVCLASLAPLASGESVSAAEVVNIINAIARGMPQAKGEQHNQNQGKGKKR